MRLELTSARASDQYNRVNDPSDTCVHLAHNNWLPTCSPPSSLIASLNVLSAMPTFKKKLKTFFCWKGQTQHLTVPPRSNFAQTRSCSIRSDRSDMSNFSTSSSTYTRENVSNASQAYKVLYMETPLCGCSPRFGRRKCRGCSKNKAPKTAMEIFGPRENRKPRSKSRENGKDNNKRRKCKNTNQDHGQPNMAALESGIVVSVLFIVINLLNLKN